MRKGSHYLHPCCSSPGNPQRTRIPSNGLNTVHLDRCERGRAAFPNRRRRAVTGAPREGSRQQQGSDERLCRYSCAFWAHVVDGVVQELEAAESSLSLRMAPSTLNYAVLLLYERYKYPRVTADDGMRIAEHKAFSA